MALFLAALAFALGYTFRSYREDVDPESQCDDPDCACIDHADGDEDAITLDEDPPS